MKLDEYQRLTQRTDQAPKGRRDDVLIPLLGVAGEIGTLLAEHKKHLRDGPAYKLYPARVAEELGDILWYVANLATKFDLSLAQIARDNLAKTADRFGPSEASDGRFFDADFPEDERLPRHLLVTFEDREVDGVRQTVAKTDDGQPLGDPLTDNAHVPDGYRFHDVFHLAYAAHLGWSPVARRNLGCKRRSDPRIDEVEDGGRAIVTEEAIAAFMFDYAAGHGFFESVESVDFANLKTIKSLTAGFEVKVRAAREWETAILAGFEMWRRLRDGYGGTVRVDLNRREIAYVG